MNSTNTSAGLLLMFARYPILGGIFGLAAVILGLCLGLAKWQELQYIPNEPGHILLADAIPQISKAPLWVIIDDIKWDCGHIYYRNGDRYTYSWVLFTDEKESVWGMAIVKHKVDCEQVEQSQFDGYLRLMDNYSFLHGNGFAIEKYEKGGIFLEYCTYCNKGNTIGSFILGGFMFFLGLMMYPLSRGLRRNFQKKGILPKL